MKSVLVEKEILLQTFKIQTIKMHKMKTSNFFMTLLIIYILQQVKWMNPNTGPN